MPRFSLRQIFVAVVALAAGFAIARLPAGRLLDVPLAVLSFYFILSLCAHAAATRRLLVEQGDLPREQRSGGRLLLVELLAAALALIWALIFGYLAAAETLLTSTEEDFLEFVSFPMLPRDLAVLAMLVAIGLGSWHHSPPKATPTRQKVYAAVAAAGALVVLIAYWAKRMLLWFLVYVAISGVESARSPQFLPPEMKVNASVRIERFVVGSFAGLPLVIANVLLIAGLVKWWNRPCRRWLLLASLVAGLAGECWCAAWIAGPGLRQLSPSFQQALRVPPLAAIIVIASMILLAVAAFSWRMLAKTPPVDRPHQVRERPLFFHENWWGSLSLGAFALTSIVIINVTEMVNSQFTLDWETIVYYWTSRPAEFIWLAAAIGGFALAWVQWKRRSQSVEDLLPCVNPAQFSVTMLSLLILIVASAPVLAAVSFSYWFVRFKAEYW